jgi:cell division protein FtsQ
VSEQLNIFGEPMRGKPSGKGTSGRVSAGTGGVRRDSSHGAGTDKDAAGAGKGSAGNVEAGHDGGSGEGVGKGKGKGKAARARAGRERTLRTIGYLVVAVVIIGLSLGLGYHFSSESRIDQVSVSGNVFTKADEIIKRAAVPAGIHSDSLNVIEVMNRVEKLPWVREARLSLSPFGRLDIAVTERRPIALLLQGDASVYVDADGVKLPLVPGRPVDVPLLYGFPVAPLTDTLTSESFRRVAGFLLAAEGNPAAHRTLSEIGWAGFEGVVALSHDNGIKLIFGSENFEERLRNWTAFYNQVIPEKGISRFMSIDFRYQGQIITHES